MVSRHILGIVFSLTFHFNDTLKEKFYRTGKRYLIEQNEWILKARFLFHLILGYFIKPGLDCSITEGLLLVATKRNERYLFHLILGYFIKPGLDCSRTEGLLLVATKRNG